MFQWECPKCGMSVKGLACAKCNKDLILETITDDQNREIQVAKCPNGCGQIKSPQCCGHDMSFT